MWRCWVTNVESSDVITIPKWKKQKSIKGWSLFFGFQRRGTKKRPLSLARGTTDSSFYLFFFFLSLFFTISSEITFVWTKQRNERVNRFISRRNKFSSWISSTYCAEVFFILLLQDGTTSPFFQFFSDSHLRWINNYGYCLKYSVVLLFETQWIFPGEE